MVQPSALPEAVELCDLLSRYELEGLLYAHDLITREQSDHTPAPMTPNSVPNHSPTPPATTIIDTEDDQDSDIKVIKIKIEKTNEPLVRSLYHQSLLYSEIHTLKYDLALLIQVN